MCVAGVGSRPCLPIELNEVYMSDTGYNDCIAVYFTCTSEDPDERPSAEQLLHAFETGDMSEIMNETTEDEDGENSVEIIEEIFTNAIQKDKK